MDVQQKIPPILIYYNVRGQAQAIRGFFCYLQASFTEVHLERFEQQRKILPSSVLNKLKNVKIDKSLLPILIDDRQMISDTYQIMAYLCYKHQQEQLLGSGLREKAILQQIIEIYVARQPSSKAELFRFSEFFATHTKDECRRQICRSYSNLMGHSEYLRQICMCIHNRKPERYVLNNISILDFLFLQSCTYMLGVFNNLDSSCPQANESDYPEEALVDGVKYGHLKCLKIMRNYRERMIKEPFYVDNQEYLESFSIITPLINQTKIKGLRMLWQINPKFVQ